MSKAVNEKWKKTFPDTIGNQNRPAEGVDDTQPFETGAFPQYMANDPVRYDLQNAAMSQSMSNDARLKEMVDARGKELDDHKVDPGAHKTGIAGNAATATKVVTNAASGASANIAEASMASSDSARIRVSGANNAGELALETADDGNEAIVARQYTGDFKDVARTASILDGAGNTSFPGTVIAPKFTGALNGNAATASKLASPRTLSLTGKAAGSTSFDGSADAAINVTSVNADTASKLSSARKINITGDATGAAAFDGSGDISINTTVNESKHAATATQVVANAPTGGGLDVIHAVMASDGAMRIRIYGDVNNGALEIATGDDGTEPIYARQYKNSSIDKFTTVARTAAILDANGNTSFPGTVTAASFTGPLNGNAATATNSAAANKVNNSGNRGNLASGQKPASGLQVFQCYTNAGYPQQYGNVLSIGGTGDNEFFLGWQADARPYYRSKVDVPNDWTDWKALAYISDINNYAPTKTGSGASGTWPISISGNAATATTATSATTAATCTGNSATASKLATARSIALTGNATGSANFDGSGNISISTNVNTATNADTVDGYHASDIISKIYPVGSIYMSMNATNPATLFGVGTWARISQGRMLLGADDSTYEAGATGGEADHTLSVDEMPVHSHGISNSGKHTHYFYGSNSNNGQFTEGDGIDTEGNSHFTHNERFLTSSAGDHTHTIDNAGGGAAHNNMPPYLVCYIWQRTA